MSISMTHDPQQLQPAGNVASEAPEAEEALDEHAMTLGLHDPQQLQPAGNIASGASEAEEALDEHAS